MKKSSNPIRMRSFVRIIILLYLVTTSFTKQSLATVLTVDNNYPRMGQFATIQEAHDAANGGDTIQVFPSPAPYNAIDIKKRLIFIGNGFSSIQPNFKNTIIEGIITFSSGSTGSIIQSFGGFFNVYIYADNISVKRNQISHIFINSGHLGTLILQNYITGSSFESLIEIKPRNEAYISNNILHNNYEGIVGIYTTGYGSEIKADSVTNTTCIINNFIRAKVICSSYCISNALVLGNSNSYVVNNIMYGSSISGSLDGFFNNICDGQQIPTNNGNLNTINMSDIFIDFNNNDFHLKPGSPAIGTGLKGIDIGIYGGDAPFVDGGYPDIPSIYYLDVPLIAKQKDGINVTIKAKSNQ